MKSLRVHREISALLNKKPHEKNIRTYISDHRSCGSTCRTPAKPEDHHRVQNDIHNRTKHRTDHRCCGKTLCTQLIGRRQRHNDKRSAQCDTGIILRSILPGCLTCTQQPQNRASQKHQNNGNHHTADNGPIKTEHTDPLRILEFLFPEKPGNKRTSAQAKNISKGDHQRKDRCTQSNTRHQIRIPGSRNKISIYHIIDQRNHHTEHNRKRQLKIRLRNRILFKNLFLHFIASISV